MSAPLQPSPLDYVGRRRFAFYPPIAHPDPNEWLLGSGSRSEVQAVNTHTGGEIWIPRRYIGAVSETSSSLLLVGLTEALEFRAGIIEPRVKRIIEMTPSDSTASHQATAHRHSSRAPVIGIRLESRSDSTLTKALVISCIGAILVALLSALITAAARF